MLRLLPGAYRLSILLLQKVALMGNKFSTSDSNVDLNVNIP